MRWTSFVAIYFLIWMFCVFLVLPFEARQGSGPEEDRIPGQADSAPAQFRGPRVALRVTIVATIVFALFALNYDYGWVTPDMLALFGGMTRVKPAATRRRVRGLGSESGRASVCSDVSHAVAAGSAKKTDKTALP